MRKTTEQRSCARVLAVAAFVLVTSSGCRSRPPPFDHFEVKLEPQLPGKSAPEPPSAAFRPWRVWVNQEQPRQKKNPQWASYGAKDGALVDLSPDGHWSCLLTPVTLVATSAERGGVGAWTASRSLRCSSDHWRSYVESRVRAAFDPQGKPGEIDPSGVLYLSDIVAGALRSTVVVLEGKKVAPRPDVE